MNWWTISRRAGVDAAAGNSESQGLCRSFAICRWPAVRCRWPVFRGMFCAPRIAPRDSFASQRFHRIDLKPVKRKSICVTAFVRSRLGRTHGCPALKEPTIASGLLDLSQPAALRSIASGPGFETTSKRNSCV